MPLYMDIHRAGTSVTRDDVMAVLGVDAGTRSRGETRVLRYWYDLDSGSLFCLIEAPDQASAGAVHVEVTRLPVSVTMEVEEGR